MKKEDNDQMYKSSSTINMKKTYLLKKLDLNNDIDLGMKLNNAFNNPDTYLDATDKDLIIGKINYNPRLTKSTTFYVGKNEDILRTLKSKQTLISNYTRMDTKSIRQGNKPKKSYYISENGIGDIYEKFKNLKLKSKHRIIDSYRNIDPYVKKEMGQIFHIQENSLKLKEESALQSDRITQHILAKTKKKEDQVLMKTIDSFRIKKELKETVELKKTIEEKYGNNFWMISLRRPKEFQGTRHAFVNIGTQTQGKWIKIKENVPELPIEKIRRPESLLCDITPENFFKKTLKKIDFEKIQKIGDMIVKGTGLMELEQEKTKEMKGRKIIYRRVESFNPLKDNTMTYSNCYDKRSLLKLKLK